MRIKELREAAGLSLAELGALVGVSRQAVNQWEAGTTWPSSQILPQLAAALGCGIGDLYEDEENPGGASPSPTN